MTNVLSLRLHRVVGCDLIATRAQHRQTKRTIILGDWAAPRQLPGRDSMNFVFIIAAVLPFLSSIIVVWGGGEDSAAQTFQNDPLITWYFESSSSSSRFRNRTFAPSDTIRVQSCEILAIKL